MANIVSETFGGSGSVTDSFTNLSTAFVPYLLYSLLGLVVIYIFYRWYKNKEIFKFRVILLQRRSNGNEIEKQCKGGFVKDKYGVPVFRLKLHPYKPWLNRDLYQLPDAKKIYAGNTIYYNQVDPWTFFQVEKKFETKRQVKIPIELIQDYQGFYAGSKFKMSIEDANLLEENGIIKKIGNPEIEEKIEEIVLEPIANDVKAIAIRDIQNVERTIDREMTKQVAIVAGGLFLMFLAFIIGVYFMSQGG